MSTNHATEPCYRVRFREMIWITIYFAGKLREKNQIVFFRLLSRYTTLLASFLARKEKRKKKQSTELTDLFALFSLQANDVSD